MIADIAVTAATPAAESLAKEVARQLQLPYQTEAIWVLEIGAGSEPIVRHQQTVLMCSFRTRRHRYFQARAWQQKCLLAKAVGCSRHFSPTVVDATAGLGEDAFKLKCLGAQLILIERSPIVAYLLREALGVSGHWATLYTGDACVILPKLVAEVDVVYLDPMFPPTTKTAAVKKGMQFLRLCATPTLESEELFAKACALASKRVVIKRAKHAAPLTKEAPTYSLTGQTVRYDVYTVKVRKS